MLCSAVFHYYGSAIEDGIDWTNFGGTSLAAFVMVLQAVLAFRRRDIACQLLSAQREAEMLTSFNVECQAVWSTRR